MNTCVPEPCQVDVRFGPPSSRSARWRPATITAIRAAAFGAYFTQMDVRELYERERPKWSRASLWLWILVAYVLLIYVSLRWGGHDAVNLLPSAD